VTSARTRVIFDQVFPLAVWATPHQSSAKSSQQKSPRPRWSNAELEMVACSPTGRACERRRPFWHHNTFALCSPSKTCYA